MKKEISDEKFFEFDTKKLGDLIGLLRYMRREKLYLTDFHKRVLKERITDFDSTCDDIFELTPKDKR